MFSIDGYDIEVTRGDTLVFEIEFYGRTVANTAQAVFTVKKRPKDTEAVIEKTYTVTNDCVTVELTPEDTDLKPGTYWWDVRVKTDVENGTDVRTPMEYATLQILEVVGNG